MFLNCPFIHLCSSVCASQKFVSMVVYKLLGGISLNLQFWSTSGQT